MSMEKFDAIQMRKAAEIMTSSCRGARKRKSDQEPVSLRDYRVGNKFCTAAKSPPPAQPVGIADPLAITEEQAKILEAEQKDSLAFLNDPGKAARALACERKAKAALIDEIPDTGSQTSATQPAEVDADYDTDGDNDGELTDCSEDFPQSSGDWQEPKVS